MVLSPRRFPVVWFPQAKEKLEPGLGSILLILLPLCLSVWLFFSCISFYMLKKRPSQVFRHSRFLNILTCLMERYDSLFLDKLSLAHWAWDKELGPTDLLFCTLHHTVILPAALSLSHLWDQEHEWQEQEAARMRFSDSEGWGGGKEECMFALVTDLYFIFPFFFRSQYCALFLVLKLWVYLRAYWACFWVYMCIFISFGICWV